MAKKKTDFNYSAAVNALRQSGPARVYLLYGPEDYLRECYLTELRRLCVPEENEFSLHRLDGQTMTLSALAEAVESMPFFTERTLVEVRDYDLNRCRDADCERLKAILADIPDYCTLVFVQSVLAEPDGRLAAVKAVKKGAKGDPGELKGDFSVQRDVGTVSVNSDGGIFGTVADPDFLRAGTPVPVATARQVKTGPATILTTISNDDTAEYTVQIVRVFSGSQSTRNLLLKVTDQRLLDATGGIVQGMSGSPILQDGRIVGAVTHVLLNDPTQGYGILMENMLAMAG